MASHREEVRGGGLKSAENEWQLDPAKGESSSNIVGLLKTCTSMKDLGKGSKLHAYLQKCNLLVKDIKIGSTLVNMYAKCGELSKAYRVLEELPLRNVVSWSALIAGYAQQGQGEEALKCFDDMLREGLTPDAVSFLCALKACGDIGAAAKGEEIHDMIITSGMLQKDTTLGNSLVYMYAKCGVLSKAQQVLDELPIRDVVTWSTLIAGYTQQQQGKEALKCFDDMLWDRHFPDAVTFICALKACGSIRATAKGEKIHEMIISLGMLEKDVVLGNALVDMYAKCGVLAKAQRVLEELSIRNVVTWSALMFGYVQHGQEKEAIKCFDDMLDEGHSPDAVTFICALKACRSIGAAAKGKEIHDRIVSLGLLEKDIVLANTLVHMYAKCGAVTKAQQLLEQLPFRNVVTWSALVAGYAQQGQGEEALKCLEDMLHEGHTPDVESFTYVLKACGSIGAAGKGEEIHDRIVSSGMLKVDIALGNSLVDMYSKCGALSKAHEVLEKLPIRDLVTWNALITGYAQHGQEGEVLKCFNDMRHEGHFPDVFTFTSVLKACGSIGAGAMGKEIHDMIVSLGMLEKHVALGSTLVDMYAKCGMLTKARRVLEELSVRNVVSWSVIIAGYAQQGQGEEALRCFDDMLHEGHSPDAVTFICVLKACGAIGAITKGEEIHRKIVSLGMLEKDIVLGNSLVDMYMKCGSLTKVQQVLKELPVLDVSTWNAVIAGYAQQGQSLEVIKYFESMQANGVEPNFVTFTSVLNACTHSGLLYQAEALFSQLSTKYGIHPNLELCCCMTDLFCRAGDLNRALSVIACVPSDQCLPNWVALLGACCKYGEVKIAELIFERALHLDRRNATVYVLMGNIYTAAGMQEKAKKIEAMRMSNKAWKSLDIVW